jgi:hypothetical protein
MVPQEETAAIPLLRERRHIVVTSSGHSDVLVDSVGLWSSWKVLELQGRQGRSRVRRRAPVSQGPASREERAVGYCPAMTGR